MLELLKQLISCPSITPDDAGCQTILIQALREMGFSIESLPFGKVSNTWAQWGTAKPLFVFAGHTDVVPPGPLDQWQSPPFSPTIKEGYLIGRGAADMKGAIACMVTACKEFLAQHDFPGSIAFLITSDEEGPHNLEGTKKVIEFLDSQNKKIDYCIVGEASSKNKIGDSIKIGRRGSISAHITLHGKQGHVAYPKEAINPITLALPCLNEITTIEWDKGNEFFPPTSLQITHLQSGNGTANVIPGELELIINLRFSPASSVEKIKETIHQILEKHALNYSITWNHSASPFLTKPGYFVDLVSQTIFNTQGYRPELATDGGTSDARFISPTGAQVIELGVCRETIHQVNEQVKLSDLDALTKLYFNILVALKDHPHG